MTADKDWSMRTDFNKLQNSLILEIGSGHRFFLRSHYDMITNVAQKIILQLL